MLSNTTRDNSFQFDAVKREKLMLNRVKIKEIIRINGPKARYIAQQPNKTIPISVDVLLCSTMDE